MVMETTMAMHWEAKGKKEEAPTKLGGWRGEGWDRMGWESGEEEWEAQGRRGKVKEREVASCEEGSGPW